MNYLSAKIDRIEGDFVILKTDDNQEISWSKDNLPPNAKEGTKLSLELKSENQAKESQEKLAKEILNEILKRDLGPNP